jgi:O2-independent ubiquinone biosynthesis accessory factor UbiT
MQILTENEKPPILPKLISIPFRMMPVNLHSKLLVNILNRLLIEQINDGELDFLENRRLCINVTDAGIKYHISLHHGRLTSESLQDKNDIEIKSCIYDFLQLAARKQDPDTLVFQRRLVMQGDTELGLEIKNFLDSLDLESSAYFSKIESFLQKSLPIYQRMFS